MMAIRTPHGMSVKHVVKLDSKKRLATVEGYRRQQATYRFRDLLVDGGIDELRESHRQYMALRLPIGTRIRIRCACTRATEGEFGQVTGHDEVAGHTVTTDRGETFPAFRGWDFDQYSDKK